MVEQNYFGQNILSIAAEFCALSYLIFLVFALVARLLNKQVVLAKLMRSLYFVAKPKELKERDTKYTFVTNLMSVKVDFFNKWFKYSRAG